MPKSSSLENLEENMIYNHNLIFSHYNAYNIRIVHIILERHVIFWGATYPAADMFWSKAVEC